MTERILEIGDFAAGFCGRLFVHAGCEVVRIESPCPAPGWVTTAASDRYLHAGKRRLATADPDLIAELAAKADVVVAEAATAADLDALGFDRWQCPVRAAITPFGRTGPKRNWQATAHVLLAMGGYTHIMGDADRAPLSLPGHYLEFQAGQYAYIAANACRLAGTASSIDIGMLETVMSLSQFTTVRWHCAGEIRSRHGNELWSLCPINLYRVRDGWAYLNVVPDFWDTCTLFIDRPELAVDERFTSNARRMANRDALNDIIADFMITLSKADAEQRAEELRIPLGVVQTFPEVLADPHLAQREFWQQIYSPDGTAVRAPAVGHRFDGLPHGPLQVDEPEHPHG